MVKKYQRFGSEVEKDLYKITITVSGKTLDWFHKLRRTMKKKGGHMLPRSYIIRAFFNVFMELDIDIKGIKTGKNLEKRINQAIEKH